MPAGAILTTAVKSAVVLLVCLIVADIAGVIACTILDIAPVRGGGGDIMAYAIWPVLGIFCGLIAYGGAGSWASGGNEDWAKAAGACRTSTVIVATSAVLLVALALFFHRIYWSRGVAGEYYVPDSAPHSILFFLAVLGGIVFASFALGPEKKDDAGGA